MIRVERAPAPVTKVIRDAPLHSCFSFELRDASEPDRYLMDIQGAGEHIAPCWEKDELREFAKAILEMVGES